MSEEDKWLEEVIYHSSAATQWSKEGVQINVSIFRSCSSLTDLNRVYSYEFKTTFIIYNLFFPLQLYSLNNTFLYVLL